MRGSAHARSALPDVPDVGMRLSARLPATRQRG